MSSLEARKLRQFIEQQDQTSRHILLLHYFDQLTDHEIGLVLDLSQSVVERRLAQLQRQAKQQVALCQSVKQSPLTSNTLSAIA